MYIKKVIFLIFIIAAIFSMSKYGFIPVMTGLAVILGSLLFVKKKREDKTKSALSRSDYSYANIIESIAISKNDNKLSISKGGNFKTYGFDQIREWQLDQHGFFVHVKDIDFPIWQIRMHEDLRKKWFEIFNQFINEDA